MTGGL